jgi:hypothetical protein
VFEKKIIKRIFGPKTEKVTGEWRKLHNEELNNLLSSPNIIRVVKLLMKWKGHVACTLEVKNTYRILVGKPEGKR